MVYILQEVLPKYRHDVLRYLSHKSFKVVYGNKVKENTIASYKANLPVFEQKNVFKIGKLYFLPFIPNRYSVLVFTPEVRNLTFFWCLFLKYFYGCKLVGWTHAINNVDFHRKSLGVMTRLRLMMIKQCNAVLAYDILRANELKKYFKGPIVVASNTLDSRELNEVYEKTVNSNINSDSSILNFIFIGRLIKEKEILKSIKLFEEIKSEIPNSTFTIIGEGPELDSLKQYVDGKKLKGVEFKGAIHNSDQLATYLLNADLQLHLGYVGLAVVHSMCFETPIVTISPAYNGPFHSPEFSYLKDERNAIIDVEENLAQRVLYLISNREKLKELKKNARDTYSSECSVENILEAFQKIKKL